MLTFEDTPYPYVVYAPDSSQHGIQFATPRPTILLVHGGGGNGPDFLASWLALAAAHGVILVAPTLPRDESVEAKVPTLFSRLIDTVAREWPVDRARVYVFGYSAGGYDAYDAAMLAGDTFAAGGVFASVITPDYDYIVSQATRRAGVASYIGGDDPFFTVERGRRTRDLLSSHGYEVHYVELPHRDHDWGAVSATVIEDLWPFLSSFTLGKEGAPCPASRCAECAADFDCRSHTFDHGRAPRPRSRGRRPDFCGPCSGR